MGLPRRRLAPAMLLAAGIVVVACKRDHAPTEEGLTKAPASTPAPLDAAVAAHSGPPEAGAPEAAAKVQRRPPPDPAVVGAHPTCARVLASNERIARRVAEDEQGPPDWGVGVWYGSDETRGDALAGFGPACLPQRDGSAWAIELLEAPLRWTIAHYDPHGKRTAIAPVPIDPAEAGGMLGPGNSIAYDFDGDGLDEIWVESSRSCDRSPAPKLYTFRGGRVVAYPVPRDARVDEVTDEDHDGRPDLVTGSFLDTPLVRCGLGDIVCAGYSFKRLLHSRPDGSFAEDDAVAIAYAQKQCPAPGGPLVTFKHDTATEVDGEATAKAIACARLRGVPADAVVAELRTHCPSLMHPLDPRSVRSCLGPVGMAPCTPAEELAWRRTCPAANLHPTCVDWMLDLAREQPTPILSTGDGGAK